MTFQSITALAPQNQRQRSNAYSIMSLAADQKKDEARRWLSLVGVSAFVSFSALTLLVGWQEVHLAH